MHKVFTHSSDKKGIYKEKLFNQKLKYIHGNPVSGKWQLLKDYTEYEYNMFLFYKTGEIKL